MAAVKHSVTQPKNDIQHSKRRPALIRNNLQEDNLTKSSTSGLNKITIERD